MLRREMLAAMAGLGLASMTMPASRAADWGTDWPHPNVKFMPNDGDLVDLIPLYTPDPAKQNKLLVTNPERLFKFDAKG